MSGRPTKIPQIAIPTVVERTKQTLMRVGGGILGAGVLTAIVGVATFNIGGRATEGIADAIHRGGLVIMLFGFLTLLLAMRWTWLYRVLQLPPPKPREDSMTRSDSETPFAAEIVRSPPASPRDRFQFSLLMLIGLMTTVAIGCGLAFAMPVRWLMWLHGPMWMSVSTILTIAVVYGRGYFKTFCIGALIASASQSFQLNGSMFNAMMMSGVYGRMGNQDSFEYRLFMAAGLGLCFILGIVAVAVRFVVELDRRE